MFVDARKCWASWGLFGVQPFAWASWGLGQQVFGPDISAQRPVRVQAFGPTQHTVAYGPTLEEH